MINAGRPGPGKYRGTHALRKRCPACKKLRRFFEPQGLDEAHRRSVGLSILPTRSPTGEDDWSLMTAQAKSVILKALAVVCPQCQALAGELCKESDGKRVEYKGHLGVHLPRLITARAVLGASA